MHQVNAQMRPAPFNGSHAQGGELHQPAVSIVSSPASSCSSQCSTASSGNRNPKRCRLAQPSQQAGLQSTCGGSGHNCHAPSACKERQKGHRAQSCLEGSDTSASVPPTKPVHMQLLTLASSVGALQAQACISRAQAAKAEREAQALLERQGRLEGVVHRSSQAALGAARDLETLAGTLAEGDRREMLAWAGRLKRSLTEMMALAEGMAATKQPLSA